MRAIQVTLGTRPVVSELGAKDVLAAVTAAALTITEIEELTVDAGTMVSADVLTEAGEAATAVAAIGTLFGVGTGLKVFIYESGTTKEQVLAALDAVALHIKSNSLFS